MDKFLKLRKYLTRSSAANGLMILFIGGTTVGSFLVFPPAGFIVGGVTCGIFGYLLGSD
jgi:hypothetical protein